MRFYRTAATTMDGATVLSHIWKLSIGRLSIDLVWQTDASVARVRKWKGYDELREQAVAVSDRDTVQFALDDLWEAGGTLVTARALLHRIIDGSYRSPWA